MTLAAGARQNPPCAPPFELGVSKDTHLHMHIRSNRKVKRVSPESPSRQTDILGFQNRKHLVSF